MILWDFLYGAVVLLVLLNLGWSAAMRNLAERVTRFKPVHTIFYWVQYLLVTSILGFPLTVYEDYFREHKYGLATQTFGPWMGDQLKGLMVNLVLGGILVVLLFGIVRRLQRAPVVDLGGGCDRLLLDSCCPRRPCSILFPFLTKSRDWTTPRLRSRF